MPDKPHYCECEHESHPNNEEEGVPPDEARRHTAQHVYCESFSTAELSVVRTIYGRYTICEYCAEDHPIPDDFRETDYDDDPPEPDYERDLRDSLPMRDPKEGK
jgi:hypothetical protein